MILWAGLGPRSLHFNPFLSPASISLPWINSDKVLHSVHFLWESLLPLVLWEELEVASWHTRRRTPLEIYIVRRQVSLSFISKHGNYNSDFWKDGKIRKMPLGRPQQCCIFGHWMPARSTCPELVAEHLTFYSSSVLLHKNLNTSLNGLHFSQQLQNRMKSFHLIRLLFSILSFNRDSETGASFSSFSKPREIRITATEKNKQIRPQQ